mmetsp:Transcript_24880/g.63154  ORF Transcript_24880/g.63154 Transcript_24880/m.63154 type:complete len:210 (+) Transcript_24880:284-913(+)
MVAAPWQKTTAEAPGAFSLSAAVLAAWRTLRSERRDARGEAALRAPPLRGELTTSTSVSGAGTAVGGRRGICTSACRDASHESDEVAVGTASSCSRAWLGGAPLRALAAQPSSSEKGAACWSRCSSRALAVIRRRSGARRETGQRRRVASWRCGASSHAMAASAGRSLSSSCLLLEGSPEGLLLKAACSSQASARVTSLSWWPGCSSTS